jgi:hypothetical protein
MLALLAVLLGVAHPPSAYVSVGTQQVPLAISSWCWGGRCGAPIAASTKTAVVSRGSTVRVELRFAPQRVLVAVAGFPERASIAGSEVTWRATHAGGITVNVRAAPGFITYVGRLRLK